jgi:hypothetical protein
MKVRHLRSPAARSRETIAVRVTRELYHSAGPVFAALHESGPGPT